MTGSAAVSRAPFRATMPVRVTVHGLRDRDRFSGGIVRLAGFLHAGNPNAMQHRRGIGGWIASAPALGLMPWSGTSATKPLRPKPGAHPPSCRDCRANRSVPGRVRDAPARCAGNTRAQRIRDAFEPEGNERRRIESALRPGRQRTGTRALHRARTGAARYHPRGNPLPGFPPAQMKEELAWPR